MTRFIPLVLGALLLAATARAQPTHRHDAKPLRIVIETIPHSQQRYPTVGDWQVDKARNLHITVSKMSDQRYEFLIASHELIEAYLARHAGVTQRAVDKFATRPMRPYANPATNPSSSSQSSCARKDYRSPRG
jgi:hypothetical protein